MRKGKSSLYKAKRLRNKQQAPARRKKRTTARIGRIMRRRETQWLEGKWGCIEQLEKKSFS